VTLSLSLSLTISPPLLEAPEGREPDRTAIYKDQVNSSNYMYNRQVTQGTKFDMGLLFDNEGSPTVVVNSSDTHAGPIAADVVANLLYKSRSAQSSASIVVRSHPFSLTAYEMNRYSSGFTLLASLVYTIAFCFVPASWAAFVVQEREVKSMHQQLVSGVSVYSYWLANWAWDFTAFLFPCLTTWAILAAFGQFEENFAFESVAVLTLMFGFSVAPFTYAFSFMFSSYSNAGVKTLGAYMAMGLVLNIASYIMDLIPDTQALNSDLKFVYYCFPPFNVGWGFQKLGASAVNSADQSDWDLDAIGYPVIFMAWSSVAWFMLVILFQELDNGMDLSLSSIWPPKLGPAEQAQFAQEEQELDPDVQRHRHCVEAANGDPRAFVDENGIKPAQPPVVFIDKLRKIYPGRGSAGTKFACKDMCLAIPEGECFGLLGVNGAGKTTTMNMLTGDFLPSGGRGLLVGKDVATERQEVWQQLGYCPQFDALFDKLTCREHLRIYGRIRGIKPERLEEVIERLVEDMELTSYVDKQAGTYSGGNKRKLSVAIALIGNPKIVILDEPSSGMDPKARRSMWAVIQATKKGRVLILTTHFMDECEYLCERIGIMVDGRMRCLGTNSHLKENFGQGYVISVDVNAERTALQLSEAEATIQGSVLEVFGACDLKPLKTHAGQMKFQVNAKSGESPLELYAVFELMNQVKRESLAPEGTPLVKNFLAGHTSLEQVFLSFAKAADEEAAPGSVMASQAAPGSVVAPPPPPPPPPGMGGGQKQPTAEAE